MQLIVCAVFDRAVGAYTIPMFFRSKSEAIRSFADAVGDPKHQFAQHAEDYTFCQLGVFDDNSGDLVAVRPERLISGTECMAVGRVEEPVRPFVYGDQSRVPPA